MKHPFRILLIDDDQDEGDIFNMALNSLSNKVKFYHVHDSQNVLTILSDKTYNPPNMIFLDCNMPKINGSQCMQTIRRIPGDVNVPIIIYSTSSNPALKEESSSWEQLIFLLSLQP